jgi:ribosomal protein S18 acetylase RimI-like enzyme
VGASRTVRVVTASLDALVFRDATPDDAERLAAVFAEGFDTYRSFAPQGWEPPPAADATENIAKRLGQPSVWCLLAENGADVAGYVALLPATEARHPVDDPLLAHFWMLFVRAPWWGSGLARRLHAAACDAARSRGFTAMRLYTPVQQARARRFYEREGWVLAGPPTPDEELGIAIVEYRLDLTASAGTS